MAKNKRIAKNEFRYNYSTKHMNFVFEESGRDYHAIGLTSKKRTVNKFGKMRKNMALSKNPQKNKSKKSYVRYGYITQNKKTFGIIDKRFNFAKEDVPKVKSKIRHFKKHRRKR